MYNVHRYNIFNNLKKDIRINGIIQPSVHTGSEKIDISGMSSMGAPPDINTRWLINKLRSLAKVTAKLQLSIKSYKTHNSDRIKFKSH